MKRVSAPVLALPNFRGGPMDLIGNREHECIVVGPADCSKSWAACVKSYLLCADTRRKNVHIALCRKTFNSIHESIGKTFRTITSGFNIQRLGGKTFTEKWVFPNGSEIVCIGLDNPEKLLSSEWDAVQVCQTEELAESDWEMIASRCTGRGATVAWPQVFGDCNPGGSKHWIRARARSGKLRLITSTHKDNPALYDDAGNITPDGVRRIGILESTLSGVRRQRLLEGIWATAEGAVFDHFDVAVHVQVRPDGEFRHWHLCLDEGYTNPAVVLLVGVDGDGRWHVAREFYRRGVLQSVVVDVTKRWRDEKRVEVVAVDDAAAGLIADLVDAGVPAVGGKGRILDGIQRLQNRLLVAGDGRPRLTIDPACVETINEMESHIWKDGKDVPVDADNHAISAARYLGDVLNEGISHGMVASLDREAAPADRPVEGYGAGRRRGLVY